MKTFFGKIPSRPLISNIFFLLQLSVLIQVPVNRLHGQSVSVFQNFPLKVSNDQRYLVNQKNQPFLYLSDTPWKIFYIWSNEEVDRYLEERRRQGFTVIQVQLLAEDYAFKNRDDRHPLKDSLDLDSLHIPFFINVDWTIRKAAEKGMAVMIAPVWLGCCGTGWRALLKHTTVEKAHRFGRFLGARYNHKNFPNIIGWIHGGDADPKEELGQVKAIAEGIQEMEGDFPRLHTGHWSSPNSTRDLINNASWLNFNATYTYSSDRTDVGKKQFQIYAASINDYLRKPAQPFFLIESEYENPDKDQEEDNRPEIIRRQVFWSVLSGSTGFTYGSANCCGFRQDWEDVLIMPAANQMKNIRSFFDKVPWHALVPDGLPDPTVSSNHRWIAKGYGTYYAGAGPAADDGINYITCAATEDNTLMIAYIPPTGAEKRNFIVRMNHFSDKVRAQWFNPVSGKYQPAYRNLLQNKGLLTFTTPGDNGSGTNDWLLLLRVHDKK